MKVKTNKTCQLKKFNLLLSIWSGQRHDMGTDPRGEKKIQSYQSKSQQLKSHTCITELKTKVWSVTYLTVSLVSIYRVATEVTEQDQTRYIYIPDIVDIYLHDLKPFKVNMSCQLELKKTI